MASSSSRLPSIGLGASAVASPAAESQATPANARKKPIQVWGRCRSPRTKNAATATCSGSVAVIMPAWEAVVSLRAKPSNTKYSPGSQTAMASSGFQSPLT